MGSRRLATAVSLLVLAAVGCGTVEGRPRTVLVSAAASLSEAFDAIELQFEVAHPDVDVQLNVAGSSALVAQVVEGAPVDVLALASEDTMARVIEEGLVAGPAIVFARNAPIIAVPAGNPAGIDGLDAFGDPDLVLGLCAEAVPCGQLAREVLAAAGVGPDLDTVEVDVRSLLTRIESGELDAGIVYATDVRDGRRAVESIPIDTTATTSYPVVRVASAPNPSDADAFIDFVLSRQGREILASFGFLSP
ncbi:MAG: molybdate ABC transporter substrate-binding protein [Nitriliruptorales bacterium]|nr:molybdate ABC transporter substrate-binding protein [Nitriliruptorales bacterium]